MLLVCTWGVMLVGAGLLLAGYCWPDNSYRMGTLAALWGAMWRGIFGLIALVVFVRLVLALV